MDVRVRIDATGERITDMLNISKERLGIILPLLSQETLEILAFKKPVLLAIATISVKLDNPNELAFVSMALSDLSEVKDKMPEEAKRAHEALSKAYEDFKNKHKS